MKSILSLRHCALLLTLAVGLTSVCGDTSSVAGPGAPATPPAAPAAPANTDAIAHYKKARELFQAERYIDAQKEADLAAALDPQLQDAKLLQGLIAARLAEHPTITTTGPATGPAEAPGKIALLTPEQISIIRALELGPKETGLTGSIDRKTLEDFWANVVLKGANGDRYTDADRNNFLNPTNFTKQVYQFLAAGDPLYINKIKLTKDPADLVTFKNRVQPYLAQNCAVCHSGPNAHGLRLFGSPTRAATDAEAYTNFYNLTQFTGKGGAHMIDRDNPDRSLLMQYALPKKDAAFPHPGKAEAPTKFAATTDPRFQEMVKWIGTLAFPKPTYGIDYNLAALNAAAATQPAPPPTTEPMK